MHAHLYRTWDTVGTVGWNLLLASLATYVGLALTLAGLVALGSTHSVVDLLLLAAFLTPGPAVVVLLSRRWLL